MDANQDNDLVKFVLEGADRVDLGIFSQGQRHQAVLRAPTRDTKNALFNWGLGAVAWLWWAGSWTG